MSLEQWLSTSFITGIVTLVGVFITNRTSRKNAQVEIDDKSRQTDLSQVRAVSEEWRVLYTTQGQEIMNIKAELRNMQSQLDETEARLNTIEKLNHALRGVMDRLISYLKWVDSDDSVIINHEQAPEPLSPLLKEAEGMVNTGEL